MLSATPAVKQPCLVIPLSGATPYMKAFSRHDATGNCIVINMELLEIMQRGLFNPEKSYDLAKRLKFHNACVKKTVIRDMGKFGKGAFAAENINEEEFLIYPGQISLESDFANGPIESQLYLIPLNQSSALSGEIVINAKAAEGTAKYIQHLPSEELVLKQDGEKSLTRNFSQGQRFGVITFNNRTYTIPFCYYYARHFIPQGTMLGIDYGNTYWDSLRQAFTFFTAAGKPLRSYTLYYAGRRSFLSRQDWIELEKNSFVRVEDDFYFYSRESLQTIKNTPLATAGATTIFTTDVLFINLSRDALRNNHYHYDDENVLLLPQGNNFTLPADERILPLVSKLENNYILVPMEKLTALPVAELKLLAAYLQTEGILKNTDIQYHCDDELVAKLFPVAPKPAAVATSEPIAVEPLSQNRMRLFSVRQQPLLALAEGDYLPLREDFIAASPR